MSATARMLVYSGRPDPEWTVTDSETTRLALIWASLTAVSAPPVAPRLGYRGVELHLDDGVSFVAASGLVTRSHAGASETRADDARVFELAVVGTAPPGALPRGVPGLDSP